MFERDQVFLRGERDGWQNARKLGKNGEGRQGGLQSGQEDSAGFQLSDWQDEGLSVYVACMHSFYSNLLFRGIKMKMKP